MIELILAIAFGAVCGHLGHRTAERARYRKALKHHSAANEDRLIVALRQRHRNPQVFVNGDGTRFVMCHECTVSASLSEGYLVALNEMLNHPCLTLVKGSTT